jgi:hypothetical protein
MKAKTILGAALLAVAVSLGGGGYYAAQSFGPAKLDAETLCPVQGAKAITLIIVDKTDPLAPADQLRSHGIISAERDGARRGERIVVDVLSQGPDGAPAALETIVDLCNPGSEANPFFENPKRVASRYESAFIEPIGAALASFGVEAPASASPIVRTIETALETLRPSPGVQVRIVLVSDMMEHGAGASAYTGVFTDQTLRGLMTARGQALLKGSEVRIALIARRKFAGQQRAALNAWRRFFLDATGQPAVVLP